MTITVYGAGAIGGITGARLAQAGHDVLLVDKAEDHVAAMNAGGLTGARGDTSEPWDGPAAIAFTDGVVAAAAVDRNGLRPCRYKVRRDGLVVAGSERSSTSCAPIWTAIFPSRGATRSTTTISPSARAWPAPSWSRPATPGCPWARCGCASPARRARASARSSAGACTSSCEGEANDYVGKGLSGGEITIRPFRRAAYADVSHHHLVIGNAVLYGATGGKLLAAGQAGDGSRSATRERSR